MSVVASAVASLPDDAPADDGATRLARGAEDADALLYYAVSTGRDVPPAVRDPIVHVHRATSTNRPLSDAEETEFLGAYAKLAAMVHPTTAATLRATSRSNLRPWMWRMFGSEPISDAQRVAYRFGLLALILILIIGGAEWTRTFINSVVTDQAEYTRVREELRPAQVSQKRLNEQIGMIDRDRQPGSDALRGGLVRQREEVDIRVQQLEERETALSRRIQSGYETLQRILPFVNWNELRNVIVPVATIMGTLVLPVLYGALGTCAFVLRTVYAEMVERSFDGRRTGEFMVRIFLGMLSGVTLQWLLVREGQAIPGGVTPAVLAFLGGYGVELLFAAIDRMLSTVITALRGDRGAKRAKPAAERKEGAA